MIVTVNVHDPVLDGVPEITPLFAKLNPEQRVPAEILQYRKSDAPLPANCCAYAMPCVALGREVVMTEGALYTTTPRVVPAAFENVVQLETPTSFPSVAAPLYALPDTS